MKSTFETRNKTYAWLMLLLFCTMQLAIVLHTHEPKHEDCYECLHHLHHVYHLYQSDNSVSECPLCEFASVQFILSTEQHFDCEVFFNDTFQINIIERPVQQLCCNHGLRAPPML